MNIGLFFGSFNPVHVGHLIIAGSLVDNSDLDKVWMVVSPHNPFKKKNNLLNEYDRLHLINLAIEGDDRLEASDIEFKLPKPSYTIDTLVHLRDKFPQHRFTLIMGTDNVVNLDKWKNYEQILEHHNVLVYKRSGDYGELPDYGDKVKLLDVPLLDISATHIRQLLKEGKEARYLLPESVNSYIKENNLYK